MNILCIHILVIIWYVELEVVIIMSRQWHKSLNGTIFTSTTHLNFHHFIWYYLALSFDMICSMVYLVWNYNVIKIIVISLYATKNFLFCNISIQPNIQWTVFFAYIQSTCIYMHHGGQNSYNWSGWNSPLTIILFIFVHSRFSWQQNCSSYLMWEKY